VKGKTIRDYETKGDKLVISFTDGTWAYVESWAPDNDACMGTPVTIGKAYNKNPRWTGISLERLLGMGVISAAQLEELTREKEERDRASAKYIRDREIAEYKKLHAKYGDDNGE